MEEFVKELADLVKKYRIAGYDSEELMAALAEAHEQLEGHGSDVDTGGEAA